MLLGPVHFSNNKSGIGFDKFAPSLSNSKDEPTFVNPDKEKNFLKGKPIKQIQAVKVPKKVFSFTRRSSISDHIRGI